MHVCSSKFHLLHTAASPNNILKQCCGSGMIYSGSGSSFEFFEIRIREKVPDPLFFEIIQKHPLNSNKKKNLAILYSILLSNSTNSQEFTVLIICSSTFCQIRINADPDPQHFFKGIVPALSY